MIKSGKIRQVFVIFGIIFAKAEWRAREKERERDGDAFLRYFASWRSSFPISGSSTFGRMLWHLTRCSIWSLTSKNLTALPLFVYYIRKSQFSSLILRVWFLEFDSESLILRFLLQSYFSFQTLKCVFFCCC